MNRDRPNDRSSARVLVAVFIAVGAAAALLAGRVAIAIFMAVLLLVAYRELRAIFTSSGRTLSLVLGGAAVIGFLWAAYTGKLERIGWIGGALIIALLATWVAVHEATGRAEGATDDISATLAASGIVGVLGSHALLIRAVPHVGFRGLAVFAEMVFACDVFASIGGRLFAGKPLSRLSPHRTRSAAASGFAASVAIGLVAGLALDPPFDIRSGAAIGALVGVLVPVSGLLLSSLEATASNRRRGPMAGVIDLAGGMLLAAPVFYWAFRTIAM